MDLNNSTGGNGTLKRSALSAQAAVQAAVVGATVQETSAQSAPPESRQTSIPNFCELKVKLDLLAPGNNFTAEDLLDCSNKSPELFRLIRVSLERERPTFSEDNFRDDRERISRLSSDQIAAIMRPIARFTLGEKVVEDELKPLIDFYLRDTQNANSKFRALFVTIQQAEERIHAEFFASYAQIVFKDPACSQEIAELCATHLNTDDRFSKPFRELFQNRLPRILNSLNSAPEGFISVVREVAALACYHFFAEGVVAETAYFGFQTALTAKAQDNTNIELLPTLLAGIAMIKKDESTHIAYGVLRLRELIKGAPDSPGSWVENFAFKAFFLSSCVANAFPVFGIIRAVHREHPDFPFELDKTQLLKEGLKQLLARFRGVMRSQRAL